MLTMQEERARYERLANQIFFNGLTEVVLVEMGFTLRSGKAFYDIQKAVDRGKNRGEDETEEQLACIADELKKVVSCR